MKKYFVLSIITLLVLFGCVSPIHYIGRTYPATSHVDIYYSPHDIKKDYEVIGKVSNSGINFRKYKMELLRRRKNVARTA